MILIQIFVIFSISKFFVDSLIIYESTVPVETENLNAGLKYIQKPNKHNSKLDNGYTACVRFNYEKLNNQLFYFGQSNIAALSFGVHYVQDAFNALPSQGGLIYIKENITIYYFPIMVKDRNTESIFSVKIWHHLCLSIDYKNLQVNLVVVNSSGYAQTTYSNEGEALKSVNVVCE